MRLLIVTPRMCLRSELGKRTVPSATRFIATLATATRMTRPRHPPYCCRAVPAITNDIPILSSPLYRGGVVIG